MDNVKRPFPIKSSMKMLTMTVFLGASSFLATPSVACGLKVDCHLKKAGKVLEEAAKDTAKTLDKALDDTGKATGKAYHDTGDALEEAHRDVVKTLEEAHRDTAKTMDKAYHDTGDAIEEAHRDTRNTVREAYRDYHKTMAKAANDSGKTIIKAVEDVGQAGESLYDFGIRELEAIDDHIENTAKRIGDGDIVGALWHLSVDPILATQENFAQATMESNIVQFAGQIVASSYGGPGGAAAYASWLAYNQTGDFGLAVRVGLITGAASWASAGIAEMPSDEIADIAQKTLLAGAVGGAAVAAAGGDSEMALRGFLASGSSMMLQSIYENQTTQKFDARPSEGPPYCMAATDVSLACAPEIYAYEWDENGRMMVEDGKPKVDIRKTNPRRPHVGKWISEVDKSSMAGETGTFMVTVSKFPGMNAMALQHDYLSVVYEFSPVADVWTIVPATVLTYYTTDAPTNNIIRNTATSRLVNAEIVADPGAVMTDESGSRADIGTHSVTGEKVAVPPMPGP